MWLVFVNGMDLNISVVFIVTFKLLCLFTVTCRPEPEVQWFHNNVRIKSSKHYDLEHIKGVYRLIIHEVNPEDAGTWKCEATNKYGQTWCSCELKVIGKSSEGHQ